jgi:hypothetical protein
MWHGTWKYSNFWNSALKQHGEWGSRHAHAPLLAVWRERGKGTILKVQNATFTILVTLIKPHLICQWSTTKLTPHRTSLSGASNKLSITSASRFSCSTDCTRTSEFLQEDVWCITVTSSYGLVTCNLLHVEATDLVLIQLRRGKLTALYQDKSHWRNAIQVD